MEIGTIFIHCGKGHDNKYPRVKVDKQSSGRIVLDISTDENNIHNITFFMSSNDLINFKNSVVSAVDNYKRGKK